MWNRDNMKNLYINGCSFTAGDNLKDEETWPYKLSKLSNTRLYDNSANGQCMGSIFLNSINHLSNLSSSDTAVVIGLTWPHRHYFTYKGWNINVTNADFPKPRLSSKLNYWRRLTSPNYVNENLIKVKEIAAELKLEVENINPIYLAKRELIKAMITYNEDYKKDLFSLYSAQIISLHSFLEYKKFNYCLVGFDSNSSHIKNLLKSNKIKSSKILLFNKTENDTSHPTAEDCDKISKKIYETIF